MSDEVKAALIGLGGTVFGATLSAITSILLWRWKSDVGARGAPSNAPAGSTHSADSFETSAPDLRGRWITKWQEEEGVILEELIEIKEQVGRDLTGIRIYGNPQKSYIFRGFIVGSTIVAYIYPSHERSNYALSYLLRILGHGDLLQGVSVWPKDAAKGILHAGPVEYRRLSD